MVDVVRDRGGHNINQGLRKNNMEAYKLLFRTYYMDLLRYTLSFGISMDDAKDLVQSAFVKFWENRSNIHDDKPIKSYLLTILKNNCLDFIKHSKIVQGYVVNSKTEADDTELDSRSPHDQMTEHELELKILEAIASLPLRCRQIFELNRFMGLKNDEIARKLDVSVKTVENQMTIALEKLRKKLFMYFL